MEVGLVDLGQVGSAIVRRLLAGGHRCVVWDASTRRVAELAAERAHGAASLPDLADELDAPRVIWLTGSADAVDDTIATLQPHLEAEDILVDCTDSSYVDDIRRGAALAAARIRYVDVGITGGAAYPERGWCLTIGGEDRAVRSLAPILTDLAGESGHLHCGVAGAGHFVNMIHHQVERCLIAVYLEAFSILRAVRLGGAELRLAGIAETWQQGSVVASPVLELIARALASDASLRAVTERDAHARGAWSALRAALDEDVATPVFASAIYAAARHRGGDFSNRLLAAVERERGHAAQGAGTA
jgi:6-phosphogluconate dehydrogenase